ncbi:holo-[acyl-carrier protein] synthase [Alkalithermobacter thermoalcaliphilus JW-YL-7 = DSM 7308]|uniref:Holo-[acyl-carrier-protein] synthase n=1 Tax=Alkalithermobacter thermoalcaliphilus JW-YL-7 = DSM 7308 TaxID=1121328 RepID=A0A150FSG3_CLOPD|nr:Holo-(acyl-carrier-protein) synthase [[Clostridium] paradoxum JW-YL-7 = DSM 7308]SHK72195.1 holo-[acyl-carrier protein] synthase [[Clostridium] paradoxum JW-YL-7 = DSM 7308]
MIFGIGIDIVEIERIEKAIEKNSKFLSRIFTDREIDYFKSKNFKIDTIAGNFAAKEAVSKAFGTGVRNFKFKDIEILRDNLGKPEVKVYNNLYELSKNSKIYKIMVSISHSKKYAVANAILIKKGDDTSEG